jgi:hypothetical protein
MRSWDGSAASVDFDLHGSSGMVLNLSLTDSKMARQMNKTVIDITLSPRLKLFTELRLHGTRHGSWVESVGERGCGVVGMEAETAHSTSS